MDLDKINDAFDLMHEGKSIRGPLLRRGVGWFDALRGRVRKIRARRWSTRSAGVACAGLGRRRGGATACGDFGAADGMPFEVASRYSCRACMKPAPTNGLRWRRTAIWMASLASNRFCACCRGWMS